jgi:hypothetical protein
VARPDPKTVGRKFRLRDYVRPFLDGAEPGQTHVSAVFPSMQDGMFKFGVVAPVHDGQRLLGLLAASIPVDARLVSLDMRQQGAGASVLGPMDWSYVDEPGPQVVAVLDGRYAEPGRGPLWADDPARALMERMKEGSAASVEADGEALCGVRVDGSPFVAVVREPQPWGLITPQLLWWIAAVAAGGVLVWRWRRW